MTVALPSINTDRLILRPFTKADAPEVQRLAGDKKVAETTLNIPHPYEDGMAEEWIATHKQSFNEGRAVSLAITDKADGRLLGAISLQIVARHRRAEMGYWIGVPYWNKGYCTEAVKAMIEYGFEKLGLNRIYAHYIVRNEASGRVMEKAGMKYEGHLRQHVDNKGTFEDLKLYGILKSDYQKQ